MTAQEKQETLRQLYEQYEQPMYRIAYAILHHTEQAEDAVSDAFLRILRNLEKFEAMDAVQTKSYIVKVIRSTAINQYQRNKLESERYTPWDDSILDLPDPADDLERRLRMQMETEEIQHLLHALNETDRSILLLRGQEGLSFREIAQRLSMKEAAARKRFERARKKIQKQKGASYYVEQIVSL